MRVFAPAAFRYANTDYPYGWQDIPQSIADTLISAGYLASEKPVGSDLKPGEVYVKSKTTGDGVTLNGITVGNASIPYILQFPDFKPSLLASFVAGTTATQSGTTVTVTATAHGIVGSTARNGWRIFWPGSPSIPAGWYQGFAWVDANTITFTNPTSQTVASESMNGGAAWTTITRCCGLTLPGNSVGPTGHLRAHLYRSGGSVTANKFVRLYVGATNYAVSLTTTISPLTTCTTTAYAANGTLFGAILVPGDGATNAIGNVLTGAVDLTQSQTVELRLNCGTAGDYIELNAAKLEVCYG